MLLEKPLTANGSSVAIFMGEGNETAVAAMEMVEEGIIISQPKITPNRIKVKEIVEEEEEDRISALPDGLLVEILSRLPSTESAIRTGTLSKRWEYLWTLVPILIFKHNNHNIPLSDFFSFVDKTLTQCRQSKLRKFALNTTYDIQFESQVNDWIRYAISCNVEELDLKLLGSDSKSNFPFTHYFPINSCCTGLRLTDCIFNPTGAISWKRLRSLYICFGNLEEDLIENILSGSPLLETLVLDLCHGYRVLDITSKSVKNLVFTGYRDYKKRTSIIEINAPNILSLTIQGDLQLRKLLLLNVSSLVEANLDYTRGWFFERMRKEAKEEMLKGLIQSLRHVKELKIGPFCSEVLSRLKAKGFIFPSNVKFPDETYSDDDSADWDSFVASFDSDSEQSIMDL